MKSIALFLVVAAGCGSKHARDICEKAADRYEKCIRDLLGPEAAGMVHAKEDIAACTSDDATVKMYETCLDKQGCAELMQCTEDYAAAHGAS